MQQAVEHQTKECQYHNTQSIPAESLLTNHECPKTSFPSTTKQTLIDHCDEVTILLEYFDMFC